ncbi:MAG: DNA repair protein RadC [Burkholderiaceae bacterium]|jgi:DNA repair protein RadC|nr:DNA repair protein RadC [Burkholderiaceae bacterium]
MAITDWPEAERPRERLLKEGARGLSNAELLAIFLRTGVRGKSAVDLGRDIMKHFGSLQALFSANLGDFGKLGGIGAAKFVQIRAILELAKRLLEEEMKAGVVLASSRAVREYLLLDLRTQEHESFVVLFLDMKGTLIESRELFRGTLSKADIYPREVVKMALGKNAASVIFAHNHPSGTAVPSPADHMLTQTLKEVLDVVDIRVLDHFIVAGADIFSFADHGLI